MSENPARKLLMEINGSREELLKELARLQVRTQEIEQLVDKKREQYQSLSINPKLHK